MIAYYARFFAGYEKSILARMVETAHIFLFK